MFRDMLSLEANKESNTPFISLDASTAVVKLFLDMMHHTQIKWPSDWELSRSAICLCESFGCDHMLVRTIGKLADTNLVEPWEVFCIASKYDNLHLAKAAIKAVGSFARTREWNMSDIKGVMLDSVTPRYAWGLAVAMKCHAEDRTTIGGRTGYYGYHWDNIGASFETPKLYVMSPRILQTR